LLLLAVFAGMVAEKDFNISSTLAAVAAEHGKRTGLVHCRRDRYKSWSFAALQDTVSKYAGILRRAGIQPGRRVMLMVRPSMDFICLTFALFRLRAVVILIDPGMGFSNLLRCIASVRPAVLIALPQVQILSRLFPRPFRSVRQRICVGPSLGLLGHALHGLRGTEDTENKGAGKAGENELAAIIFTTGSTGPPKGVRYTHGIFHAQLQLIRSSFGIGSTDVDQPGFPLFGLFSIALGARTVIPDMDPTRPAKVVPERFVASILDQQVTYSFGSPAIWNVVSRYCRQKNIVLPLRKVLMAGAPVSGELVGRVREIIDPAGEIYVPYGATEGLPLTAITGSELLGQTWHLTRQGKGTCVGRPLPGMDIRIIRPRNGRITGWDEVEELEAGTIGEIVASGPVVTRSYDHDDRETALAKIADNNRLWHRMGDMGYLDEQGRLWFCGRKAHRVFTSQGVLYTIPCEAIFNEHPEVYRSALVGVGQPGRQTPVLVVEPAGQCRDQDRLIAALHTLAQSKAHTRCIRTFLLHPGFPVDIRHNAKIFRERLADWAKQQLAAKGCLDGGGL